MPPSAPGVLPGRWPRSRFPGGSPSDPARKDWRLDHGISEDVADHLRTSGRVLVSLGSTEQHGPNRPLGTDHHPRFGGVRPASRITKAVIASRSHSAFPTSTGAFRSGGRDRQSRSFLPGPLGAGDLRDLKGPFDQAAFVAVGGIDDPNTALMIRKGARPSGVGSWLSGPPTPPRSPRAKAFLDAAARSRSG